ncbi:protoporphyrinogen oxidase HemJ [Ferrovibrio terrae]|uniref:protoporphyrinogen oxidase HemJ n=1 Tax=Ferrovibrio terrae TaxID=2594003 RepID=UPI0031377EA8
MLYEWLKALHIIAIIAWMAGMLYLPRLFVYHADAEPGSKQSETFKVMERRLLKAIINPAMGAAWIFGGSMAWLGHHWDQPWFWAKIVLVLGMQAIHGNMVGWQRAFEADRNTRSARFYRMINEIPTVLMIGIVLLVILKPF